MMTECVTEMSPTLLPYLNSRLSGLRLVLYAADDPLSSGITSRVARFDTHVGLSRLIHGAVDANGEHAFCDVFFVVQPDHYSIPPAELQPLTNSQIDKIWQAAFNRLCRAGGAFARVLPEQTDAQGKLLCWQPLLHCSKKGRHGHLLCPHCGSGLALCRDDRLLRDAGLPVYTESLQRYLNCPTCQDAQSSFYVSSAHEGGPACLHDSDFLMLAQRHLLSRQDLADDLPCIGCDGAGECFGPKNLVREHLRPLFFYPFYMLMQPAPSIHVLDFLELLAGAAFDEVAQRSARQKNKFRMNRLQQHREWLSSAERFLFSADERRFGEVLFLKLTLLDELLALSLRSPDSLEEAASGMSLEGVWVHLPVQATRLPLFWNFSLQIVDAIGRPADDGYEAVALKSRLRHFLGQAWWYVLLVNDGQSMAAVRNAVERLLSDPEGGAPPASGGLYMEDPVFSPGHLMQPMADGSIGPQWEGMWRRALALGFELVQSARRQEWSNTAFQQRLGSLRGDVRQLLFSPAVSKDGIAHAPAEIDDAADRHIAGILQAILQQWPSSPSEPSEQTRTVVSAESQDPQAAMLLPDADGDYQQTVILESHSLPVQDTAKPAEVPPESMEQTVLWQQTSADPQREEPVEALEATVHISAPGAVHSTPGASVMRSAADELEQTVLFGRPSAAPAARGDLEATVMLGRPLPGGTVPPPIVPKEQVDRSANGRKPAEPDDLEQTVILAPNLSKNRKTPS